MSYGYECYKFAEDRKPWSYANSECKAFGSHLPVAHDEEDQVRLATIIQNTRLPLKATWLGLKRWWNLKWVEDHSTKPVDMIGYSNWREGYPDATHFYAAMRQLDGEWSTGIGKAELRFMCFKPALKKEIIGN